MNSHDAAGRPLRVITGSGRVFQNKCLSDAINPRPAALTVVYGMR